MDTAQPACLLVALAQVCIRASEAVGSGWWMENGQGLCFALLPVAIPDPYSVSCGGEGKGRGGR